MLSIDKIRRNAVGRSLMWLKNSSTALELGLSPFHAIFTSIEAASSQLSLGWLRAYNQGIRKGSMPELIQGLKDMAASPVAPIMLAHEGAALPAYIEARARLGKIGLTEFGHTISGDQPHGVLESIQQFRELRKQKAIKSLLKKYPDLDQLIDDMFTGGLVIGQHRDYQVRSLGQSVTEAWTAGNPVGAVLRSIPTILQGIMYPLFSVYIPAVKYSMFLRMMTEQAAEYSQDLENGELTRATLARRVADSVENRFGELNFDNLFLNRTVKSALQFIFRSVTYKLGTAREFAGAAGGQSRNLVNWARDAYGLMGSGSGGEGGGGGGRGSGPGGEEEEPGQGFGEKALPKLDVRASWVASLMIYTVMIGSVASRLFSGKWPWEWLEEDKEKGGGDLRHLYLETVHPRTGEIDSRGMPVRMSLPTYWKDVEHASSNPVQYALSSLSTTLSRGLDIAENRDYFENYVYDPNAGLRQKVTQAAKYAFPTPFVVSNFQRGASMGEKRTSYLSAFGFPRAPSELNLTDTERLALKLSKEKRGPSTPQQMQDWRTKRERLKEGKGSPREEMDFLRHGHETMLVRTVKGLTYPDALKVLEQARKDENPEQLKVVQRLVLQKRLNLLMRGRFDEVETGNPVR